MTGLAHFCDSCGTAIRIQSKFCANCGQALVSLADTSQISTRLKIFFSYAPEDQEWLNALDRHLSLFKRQGYITSWHRQRIQPGQEWRQESLQHLSTAHIIVLLVSANFLASDYCYGFEMEQAMRRHQRKEAVVIPILVRPVDWIDAPFAELQALPRNGKPVSTWRDKDQAWTQIVSELRVMVTSLSRHSANPSPQPSSALSSLPAIWNVPHRRNPLFTGRNDVLEQIHLTFTAVKAPFTQPLALSGLAGLGKTQIALEYAYLEREHYQAVLWLTASSQETLLNNVIKIAQQLKLVEPDEQNTQNILQAVQIWFAMQRDWLLIIDDLHASALPIIRDELLPEHWHGHVLITTRIQPIEPFAHAIILDKLPDDSARMFLLKRAHLLESDAIPEAANPELNDEALLQLVSLLDGLPLALDQAGAYIYEKGTTPASYLQLFQTQRAALLSRHSNLTTDYPLSFQATWSLAFQEVERTSQAAIELLRFCSFLAPEHIPDELLLQSSSLLNLSFAHTTNDLLTFNDAIGTLLMYSLVQRHRGNTALSLHRLVQTALQDEMGIAMQQQWAEQAIHALAQIFPEKVRKHWKQCEILLPHALTCVNHIGRWQIVSQDAAQLLYRSGDYLLECARYTESRRLLERSLEIRREMLGPKHLETAQSLVMLGDLSLQEGDEEQARQYWQEALDIRINHFGPEHYDTAYCIHKLANIALQQGDYYNAEKQCLHALAIYEREQADPLWQAHCLALLSGISFYLGKHPQQQQYIQKALSFYEQASEYSQLAIARRLLLQAFNFMLIGSYEQALALFQKALEIQEQYLGDHPKTAMTLKYLGWCHGILGNITEAEHFYSRALDMYRQQVGPEHPDIADCLISQADLFVEQGQFERAEQPYQQALTLYEQSLGSKHMQTINGLRKLAACLQHQKMYVLAEQHFQQAVSVCQHQWGMNHVETIESMRQLAQCYYLQGRSQQAETILQQILACIESLDWKSYAAIPVLTNVVQLSMQRGKFDLAEILIQRLALLMTNTSQNHHPFGVLNSIFARLAPVFTSILEGIKANTFIPDKAFIQSSLLPLIPLIEESLSQIPARQRSLRANVLMTLASLYLLLGDGDTAIVHFEERLALLEQMRGPMHTDTIECLKMLLTAHLSLILKGNEEHYQYALDIYAQLQQAQAVDAIVAVGIYIVLDNLGRFEEALTAIEQAISLDSNNSELYLHKSFILSSLERYEEKLQAIEQAIQITPDNWKYYDFKGDTLTQLKRHEEALSAYNQALELAPNNPTVLISKGMTLIGLGRHEEALSTYNQALELTPNKPNILISKGITLIELGRHEKGVSVLRQAYKLDPSNALWETLGVSFAEEE